MTITFEDYLEAVHGVAPFPWQVRTAERLLKGEPMDALMVPTAAGKTALLDMALFAAALGGRRRIAFVVDRRLIVDEVVERAERIKHKLDSTDDPRLREFANRLGDIQVVRLRGGVHGDDDWVLRHEAVSIIVSTVDQIGSRLLFRGYGVSSRMAPVHAGFLGNDLLLVIDEAHLSQPFVQTVERIIRYGADIRVVPMTATPATEPAAPLSLDADDIAHPVLARRLNASKRARLRTVGATEKDFVAAAIQEARELARNAKIVGIVVNRVATARAIFEELAGVSALLLIGRSRSYDRDALLRDWLPRIAVGRDRSADESVFVVSTQTIEVGANVDFDALVTESAPLSALRQRFGRLDRLGELGETRAVILHRELGDKKIDPIYGTDLQNMWAWLDEVAHAGEVDFGIAALGQLLAALPAPAEAQEHAAVLLPSHVDILRQTGPLAPEIAIDAFLHGARRSSPDVTVVWRRDFDESHPDDWPATALARPPLSREALDIPLFTLHQWLSGKRAVDTADIGGVGLEVALADRRVLRWRGADQVDLVAANDLRAGDTVIVPSSFGGCDRFGWAPESKEPVVDIGDQCSVEAGRGHIVRLAPGLLDWAGTHQSEILARTRAYAGLLAPTNADTEIDEAEIDAAENALRDVLNSLDAPIVEALGSAYDIETYPAGLILRRSRLEDVAGFTTAGKRVLLDAHQAGVARWSKRLALATDVQVVCKAAAVHDEGKREPRFQAMLYGNPIDAAAGVALAKSGLRSRRQIEVAWRASGLPRGFRHELASLDYAGLTDPLERHLVGTHHGHGRPWFPSADLTSPGHGVIRADSGWVRAFLDLNRQYGPWRLAGMESALRAADARRSIEELDDD